MKIGQSKFTERGNQLEKYSNFASSFVSKALMAEQTFVLSQVPDPVSFIATRTSKFRLKQIENNNRILRTNEKLYVLAWVEFYR